MTRTLDGFAVDEEVLFGRGRGEQTRGTVIKLGRSKLKIRQDEARGVNRNYPVGTIWTVPPSLCTKIGAGTTTSSSTAATRPSVKQTPREALAAKGIGKGDRVEFTFRNGDGTLVGTIDRINAKRVTIKDVNSPKYARGVYCNPGSIIRKVGTAPAKPAPSKGVGQTVEFQGYSFAARGKAAIQGVITKVSASAYEVYGEGRFVALTDAEVKAVAKRDDATLVSEVSGVYGALSPENLSCDGELSRSKVRARAARLNRALKALSKEAGRTITEDETWKAWDAKQLGSVSPPGQ